MMSRRVFCDSIAAAAKWQCPVRSFGEVSMFKVLQQLEIKLWICDDSAQTL
jgi:hypothetical protein